MSQTVASDPAAPRAAFRGDAGRRRLRGTAEALLWTATAAAGRAIVKPRTGGAAPAARSPAPPAGALRRAWGEAFRKDAADVAAGLYVVAEGPGPDPAGLWRRLSDLVADAREVEARRGRRGGGVEVRDEAADLASFPPYYRQNFHFQSGGWFSQESARRYEAQVEALFAGSAGPMRRRALALLATALRPQDQRGLAIADVACGSGAFLADLQASFPRALVAGVDLSAPYLEVARGRTGAPAAQAAAERLPFADASLDALTCVYLFHELPPKVRGQVAAEFARVLKPGGVLAFADSIQAQDRPDLALPLENFPVHFHEPFYESYQATDLPALFAEAGLRLEAADGAFLTKALLFRKPA